MASFASDAKQIPFLSLSLMVVVYLSGEAYWALDTKQIPLFCLGRIEGFHLTV